jgi:hypothetical protein
MGESVKKVLVDGEEFFGDEFVCSSDEYFEQLSA